MKTILIVDDVELNRDVLMQLLEDDCRLVCANDGVAALALAAGERPDLILMDQSLPRMDGFEATRHLKTDPASAAIALSAHATKGDEERARAAGCDDFLAKPVDEDLLLEKIARQLGR